jgi:hypothetical protein
MVLRSYYLSIEIIREQVTGVEVLRKLLCDGLLYVLKIFEGMKSG